MGTIRTKVKTPYGRTLLIDKLYPAGTAVNLQIVDSKADTKAPGSTFTRGNVIDVIHALAGAINYEVTLKPLREPDQVLPEGIGAVIHGGRNNYLRVEPGRWRLVTNPEYPGQSWTDEQMHEARRSADGTYMKYAILNEGVIL